MSTAGQIVGGVVGGVIGFFMGGPAGAVYGFGIGAGIGAYIDPMEMKGPRLGDAVVQTSSVGGVITDGYGTFPTAGNIIWASPVIERSKKSGGKGGGGSSKTYHYYRSYAIGVCRGPINGFLMVKRNGKVVYDERPGGFGHSEKWLEKVEFHYGSEGQMPSPVMVGHLGVDNVPAFRGLAYIVVQEDDVTYTSGAVPQYEFVVQKLPDVYFTTEPYPQTVGPDLVFANWDLVSAEIRTVMIQYGLRVEEAQVSFDIGSAVLRFSLAEYTIEDPDEAEVSFDLASAELGSKLRGHGLPVESAKVSLDLGSALLRVAIISYDNWPVESVDVSFDIGSGELKNG